MKDFPARLRSLRGEENSKKFAKRIGVSAGALSQYENGTSFPKVSTLSLISERLGVDKNWLLNGEGLGAPAGANPADKVIYDDPGFAVCLPVGTHEKDSSVSRAQDLWRKICILWNTLPAHARRSFDEKWPLSPSKRGEYVRGLSVPDSQYIKAICEVSDTPVEWLMLGTGESSVSKAAARQERSRILGEGSSEELVMIPMVEAVLSAGEGSFETSGESERHYAFRQDFLSRKGNISQMVLMRVDGDSMEPRISDGDIVLIDQSQKSWRTGKIFAVGVEEVVYLKMMSALPGKVILSSINEAYPPLEVDTRGDLEDTVRIIGRMIWSCREW